MAIQINAIKAGRQGDKYCGKMLAIFKNNSFEGDESEALLALRSSRINHSCIPNAAWLWDGEVASFSVAALTDIPKGEEILVSYIGVLETLHNRLDRMQDWNFVCQCVACQNTPESDAMESRRQTLKTLNNELPSRDLPELKKTSQAMLEEHEKTCRRMLSMLYKEPSLIERATDVHEMLSVILAVQDRAKEAAKEAQKFHDLAQLFTTSSMAKQSKGFLQIALEAVEVRSEPARPSRQGSPAPSLHGRGPVPSRPSSRASDDRPRTSDSRGQSRDPGHASGSGSLLGPSRASTSGSSEGSLDLVEGAGLAAQTGRGRPSGRSDRKKYDHVSPSRTNSKNIFSRSYSPRQSDRTITSALAESGLGQEQPYRIAESKLTQGLGVFATRDIKPGDLIIEERPLLVLYPGEEQEHWEYWVWQKFAMLDDEAKNRVKTFVHIADKSLLNHYGKRARASDTKAAGEIAAIYFNNLFGEGSHDGDIEILADNCSRANHSCIPTTTYHYDEERNVMAIRALTKIKSGEEVFVSYIDPIQRFEERQRLLKKWGIVRCQCGACDRSLKHSKDREKRRLDLVGLLNQLPLNDPTDASNVDPETFQQQSQVCKQILTLTSFEPQMLDVELAIWRYLNPLYSGQDKINKAAEAAQKAYDLAKICYGDHWKTRSYKVARDDARNAYNLMKRQVRH